MQKTVIFGGTFNPVHNGHIDMLKTLKTLTDAERIIVIPSNIPPHKADVTAPAMARLDMCRLAFGMFQNVTVSDIEIKMGGKSFTYNTLNKLKKQGISMPYLTVGGDSLRDFEKWYRYEDILKMCRLAVIKRADISYSDFGKEMERLLKIGAEITVLEAVPAAVSSTDIRNRIKNGESIKGLVPDNILKYIFENGLYKGKKSYGL